MPMCSNPSILESCWGTSGSCIWYRRELFLQPRRNLFLVRRGESTFAFRDGQQRGIELDEGCVHGCVFGVTAITSCRCRDHFCSFAVVKGEESPLAGKMSFVFDVHFDSHR